jgi:hypothetical protein
MPPPFDPSLKKLSRECREWMEHARETGRWAHYAVELQAYLDTPGPLNPKAILQLGWVGHYHGNAACDACLRADIGQSIELLQWVVALRALEFRWHGMYSALRPDLGNWPAEFRDSMKAAGPAMLSWWDEAAICAKRFLQMVEKDQRVNTLAAARRIKQGTNDAFLACLFSQAFGIETSFKPLKPLIPEYQALLDGWRTTDQAVFRAIMQAAAVFHISRSKHGTDKNKYEFEHDMDRVFPAELLAVQALRRRDGLPEFETGHLLIDTPWAIVRDLPKAEPHPLATAVEARLKHDYPQFL